MRSERHFVTCVAWGLLVGCLAGCSTTPAVRSVTGVLPDEARGAADRHILVTVRNRDTHFKPRPGSSPRGYDMGRTYAVSPEARKLVRELEHDYGLHEVAGWPIDVLQVHCIAFRLPESAQLTAVLDQLGRDHRVESVQPLQRFTTQEAAYNDPYLRLQNGVRAMQVLEAQRWASGADVRVAVIDTGVDLAHPDLVGRVVRAYDFVGRGRDSYTADRHGTAVAGAIAAVANNGQGIVGVAPNIRLMALRACRQSSADMAECDSFTLAQALTVAIREQAQLINLSLAGPRDALLERLIASALARRIIVVGADSGAGVQQAFPADVDGVIAVRVSERGGARERRGALAAPGVDILSLAPAGRYDFASGSSMSAALVTGTVALLLEAHQGLVPYAVRELLAATSVDVQLTKGGSTSTVNACRALAALSNDAVCPAHDRLMVTDIAEGSGKAVREDSEGR